MSIRLKIILVVSASHYLYPGTDFRFQFQLCRERTHPGCHRLFVFQNGTDAAELLRANGISWLPTDSAEDEEFRLITQKDLESKAQGADQNSQRSRSWPGTLRSGFLPLMPIKASWLCLPFPGQVWTQEDADP
jgi:hypothetical protein